MPAVPGADEWGVVVGKREAGIVDAGGGSFARVAGEGRPPLPIADLDGAHAGIQTRRSGLGKVFLPQHRRAVRAATLHSAPIPIPDTFRTLAGQTWVLQSAPRS